MRKNNNHPFNLHTLSMTASHAYNLLLLGILVATFSHVVYSTDPPPLQDFCVADPKGPALVHGSASPLFSSLHASVILNGFPCKDSKAVQADDFFFTGLDRHQLPATASNSPLGSKVTLVTVDQLAGLNTLGISMARLDFAPGGVNPPHTHPRATEMLTVLEGRLEAGFVTSKVDNATLISTVLDKGDVFVFPEGLVHFQRNNENVSAVAIATFSSQNPGVVTIANSVLGSDPVIEDDILARSFKVDTKTIDTIQSKF